MSTLKALKRLQRETKAEVFLVGGFVRDYARGKKNDDLDIVVRKLDMDKIEEFMIRLGPCKRVYLEENLEVLLFRASDDKTVAQITLPRRNRQQIADKNNTLRQDSKYRDFRINSLYLPINYKSKADIIDTSESKSGLKDIQDRVISSRDKDVFKMSPIRLLRMVSLAARTGYTINDRLLEGAKEDSALILRPPAELIRKEFDKILLSSKPSRSLKLLHRLSLLHHVAPELATCVGVKQDSKYHKYDVFTHCIYTCDFTEPNLVLRLAGLLHDIGKPETRKMIGERVTFHKHEMVSVKKAKEFLNRLKYDGKTKEEVLNLVRLHMYHYTREYTDSAVRRFIKKVGINKDNINDLTNIPLFKLRQAERLGNGRKTEPVTQRQLDFEKRIKEIFERGGGLDLKDLDISGHIIIEAFGLEPGKEIGEILRYLLERVQRDKTLNNRMMLIELTLQYLKSKEHSNEIKS